MGWGGVGKDDAESKTDTGNETAKKRRRGEGRGEPDSAVLGSVHAQRDTSESAQREKIAQQKQEDNERDERQQDAFSEQSLGGKSTSQPASQQVGLFVCMSHWKELGAAAVGIYCHPQAGHSRTSAVARINQPRNGGY